MCNNFLVHQISKSDFHWSTDGVRHLSDQWDFSFENILNKRLSSAKESKSSKDLQ
jgi:hypothetical protein